MKLNNGYTIYSAFGVCIRVLATGDLQIAISEELRTELSEETEGMSWGEKFMTVIYDTVYETGIDVFADGSSLYYGYKGKIGMLSDAPTVVIPAWIPDVFDGNERDELDFEATLVFWYPNYMVSDLIEDFLSNGELIFTKG